MGIDNTYISRINPLEKMQRYFFIFENKL